MRRKTILAGAFLAATCFTGGAVTLPTAAASMPQAAPEPSAGRMETFASCLSERGAGDVVILLDESGSLKKSDPDGNRVRAAQQLLDQWAELPRRGVTLDVRVAGFADDIAWAGPWHTLDRAKSPADSTAVKAEVASFGQRNTGDYTDYWSALQGASADLAAKARGSKAGGCQAIVWFSDGKLDVSPTYTRDGREVVKPYTTARATNAEATTAAADDLCRSGGLADQIRGREIALFGVGLQSSGTDAQTFDLMKRVATGVSPNAVCGDRRMPVPGTFETADNLDGLLLAFHKLGTPNGGRPTTQQEPVCADDTCAKKSGHAIALDPSIGAVDVFVTSKAVAPDLVLTAPNGKQGVFPTAQVGVPVTRPLGDASVMVTPRSATAATVRMIPATSGPTGVWRLTVVDRSKAAAGSESTAVITVTSDLVPSAVVAGDRKALAGSTVEAGRPLNLAVELHKRGQTTPVAVPAGARVEAAIITPGASIPTVVGTRSGAQLATPIAVQLEGVRSGSATLRLALDLETTAGGVTTALRRQTVDIPFTVAPQAGTPQVPASVDFGRLDGDGAIDAQVSIAGEGCVWLAGAPTLGAMPKGVEGVSLTSTNGGSDRASCIRPTAAQPAQLSLRLQPDHAGNGTLDGTIPIAMLDSQGRELPAITVAFRAEQTKPLEAAQFWPAMIGAFLLGVGIPVGLLYLVKWRATRLPARPLSVGTFAVTAGQHDLLAGGAPLALDGADLRHLAVLSEDRRTLAAGVARVTARSGLSPFGTGYARVDVPGHAVVTSHQQKPARKPHRGVLPLVPGEAWILAHDLSGAADTAQLVLLVPAEQSIEQSAEFLRIAAADARDAFDRLCALRPSGGTPNGASPLDGGLSESHGSPWGSGLDDPAELDPFTVQGAAAASSAAVTAWNLHGASWDSRSEPTTPQRSDAQLSVLSGEHRRQPAPTTTAPIAVTSEPDLEASVPEEDPAGSQSLPPMEQAGESGAPVDAAPEPTEVAQPEEKPESAGQGQDTAQAPTWGLDDLFDLDPTDTQNSDSSRRGTP